MQFVRGAGEESVRPRRLPPPPPSRNRPPASSRTPSSKTASSQPASAKTARFDPNLLPESLLELQRGLEQSPPSAALRADPLDELVQVSAEDSEETVAVEISTRVDLKAHVDEEDRHYAEAASELERVTTGLRRLGRLPAAHPDLTLPILLSIESMYAELGNTSEDVERYIIVRDAFPNETHLRIALSSLIALLDPNTPNAESLHTADAEGLISMLLFAERRLGNDTESRRQDAAAPLRPPAGHFS
jgi:hypothetical protein